MCSINSGFLSEAQTENWRPAQCVDKYGGATRPGILRVFGEINSGILCLPAHYLERTVSTNSKSAGGQKESPLVSKSMVAGCFVYGTEGYFTPNFALEHTYPLPHILHTRIGIIQLIV